MTTDVLRLQGDYLVQTRSNGFGNSLGGNITLDVGWKNDGITHTGTVYVVGNLVVKGTNTAVSSTNTNISDNILTLNAGDTNNGSTNPGVTLGTAGIKIARGVTGNIDADQYAAFLVWNNEGSTGWQGTGAISKIPGIWEFRVGNTGRPQYSAIKVNAIRIDENSASTSGAGAGQGTRLNIFGSDNPTSVLSVSGTNNYESRVTDPDDIPNKAYVDALLVPTSATASKLVVGKSYVTLTDSYSEGVTSEIIGILNGNPSDPNEKFNVDVATTGTAVVAMRITSTTAQFKGIELIDNQIVPVGANRNLRLKTNGTGQIVLEAPMIFQEGNIPAPGVGETGLYVAPSGGGGTGVFFIKRDNLGIPTQDEFVSRKKALIYSIIFG